MSAPESMRLYIAFYMDENVSQDLARALVKNNYDILTARDAGMLGKSDPAQMEYAAQNERAHCDTQS